MTTPTRAGNSPIAVEIEEGKKYAWCACGLSSKQPYCDGSHKGSGMAPIVFTADESKTAYLCLLFITLFNIVMKTGRLFFAPLFLKVEKVSIIINNIQS